MAFQISRRPLTGPIPKTTAHRRAKRAGMNANHLKLVRQCPCAIERRHTGDVEAHHLMLTGERGMGKKSPDRYTIPLSAFWHAQLHAGGSKNETEFLYRRGVCGLTLAAALWVLSQGGCNSSKLELMRRAIMEHRPGGPEELTNSEFVEWNQ